MEKLIDLHTHSSESDGSMTPAQLVRHAADSGLSAIALTDHDTVKGLAQAMEEGKKAGIEVVPGIEISASSQAETHILGYYIDTGNRMLASKLDECFKLRLKRNEVTCRKLNELGFNIDLDEIRKLAGGQIIGRAHFARLMVDKGYAGSVKEAFDLYLGSGKYAYCGEQRLTDEEAVKLIKSSGGMAFAAHLHHTKLEGDELRAFLIRLKDAGLDGVEGIYTEYTEEMGRRYRALAAELGLLISGGSDFHGANKPHIAIGKGTGNLRIPYEILENIKSAKEKADNEKI
ncbi:MAG: PHP domain-containing protein [Clostridia bacterium]|nr:PHP domain-containing protein [Clostridia bacterium]